jgi:hypothetical protein
LAGGIIFYIINSYEILDQSKRRETSQTEIIKNIIKTGIKEQLDL